MGIPVATREFTPRACRNSRKSMRLPPRHEMRPNSPALHAEQLCFPNQTHKEPRFVYWTLESPQQDCSKTRRTLMSPQERKIEWCTPNQLKMKHISPSLNPYHSLIPHHIQQVSWHPLQQSRDSLRHPSIMNDTLYQKFVSQKELLASGNQYIFFLGHHFSFSTFAFWIIILFL